MKSSELKNIWKQFNMAKNIQLEIIETHNVTMLDIDTAVLIFIGSHQRVTISKILKMKYFRDYGMSTIKRAVDRLLRSNLISKEKDTIDGRKNLLTVVGLS
jgi:DNA-binding MarR family transcriptional regulator